MEKLRKWKRPSNYHRTHRKGTLRALSNLYL